MNRRDLLRRGPLALLGIGAAAVGIKAVSPPAEDVVFHVRVNAEPGDKFRVAVVKSVIDGCLLERNTSLYAGL